MRRYTCDGLLIEGWHSNLSKPCLFMPMFSEPRVIAVKEHFSTPELLAEIEGLAVFRGEEPERNIMAVFPQNPQLRNQVSNLETRFKEMDNSDTGLAILSLNPPGTGLYRDVVHAADFARRMNDVLVEIIQARPDRFWGLGSLAPQAPVQTMQEIRRITGPLGLGDVMASSHMYGPCLDEPENELSLAALEEENTTLYLHPCVLNQQMLSHFKNDECSAQSPRTSCTVPHSTSFSGHSSARTTRRGSFAFRCWLPENISRKTLRNKPQTKEHP